MLGGMTGKAVGEVDEGLAVGRNESLVVGPGVEVTGSIGFAGVRPVPPPTESVGDRVGDGE